MDEIVVASTPVIREEASMHLSDGIRLDADLYYPANGQDLPVLLLRQAYGRRIASTLCYAHPAWYAAQGYLVVVQDARGRGTSEGEFDAFETEAQDGAETIAWAAALPRANGRVGTYGFSYQGTNQLQAACLAPPALKAMAPAMIGWDVRNDWAYEGGAFNLLTNIAWAAQLTAETVKRKGDVAAFSDLSASPFAHISGATAAGRPPVVEKHLLDTFYGRWLDPGNEDGYWDRISPAHSLPALRNAAIPALFVGGWFDSHLPGTIAGYRALEDTGTARLYIGPWAHFPVDRKIAGEDYGPDAVSNIDRLQVVWFDAILKEGRMPETDQVPPVSLFDLGAKRWNHMASWPAESAQALYLASDGRAAIDIASGTLSSEPEAPSSDMLVHDPWRPVPAVGCGHGIPPGPQNRDQVDNRPDVLTYTTAPLDAELAVAGACEALLYLDADQPAFDVSCTLSRVTPDGRSTGIAAGYLSLRAHDGDGPLSIPLRGTCITFQPGDSLRLSIAAAAWPTYPVNPGSGAFPADVHRSECRIITLQLKHGLSCPSQLRLTKETQA